MARLIDADDLKRLYTQSFVNAYGVKCAEMFRGVVNQMPTAYDKDKVVEELEELREKDRKLIHLTQKEFEFGEAYTYNRAIDDFESKILGNCSAMLKDGERVIVVRMDIFKFIIEQLKRGGKNDD